MCCVRLPQARLAATQGSAPITATTFAERPSVGPKKQKQKKKKRARACAEAGATAAHSGAVVEGGPPVKKKQKKQRVTAKALGLTKAEFGALKIAPIRRALKASVKQLAWSEGTREAIRSLMTHAQRLHISHRER